MTIFKEKFAIRFQILYLEIYIYLIREREHSKKKGVSRG